jgi:hypothetical protein
MKIVIISAYTNNIKEYADLSNDSITKYCNKHNIQCFRFLLENKERAPSWYKLPLIIEQFNLGYDYVVWVDADTTIINYDYDLLSILDDKSIYLVKDINNFNCGVMIWKRNDFTYDILNKMWSMVEFINHHWWEQAAFINLYEQNYNDLQTQVKIINQSELNSYDYSLYNLTYPQGQVNNNSWLIHFPGLTKSDRIQLIKKYKTIYDISN